MTAGATAKVSGSRERIVRQLLKGKKTVDELASSLGVTKNAIRAQIALLEREGRVEVQGEQKSTRRPAAVYGLAAGKETPLSAAYPAVLAGVIGTMSDRLRPDRMEELLRETGRRIADGLPKLTGSPRERVEGAVKVLGTLGSLAEVIEENGRLVIKGHGCPLSRAVQADERTCLAMEALLSRMTGLKVQEKCDHGEHPECRFEIRLPAASRTGLRSAI